DDRRRLCGIGVDWLRSASTDIDRRRLMSIGVDQRQSARRFRNRKVKARSSTSAGSAEA
ncbi:hypothetical protein KI387_009932, partial [Taxus chinensis]